MTNDHGGPSANHSRDEAAVRALYQELMDGWNQGSGAAFAAVFTEDGDLVAFDGTHFKGRQEIAPFHQQLFDKWLKGSRLVGEVKIGEHCWSETDALGMKRQFGAVHLCRARLEGLRAWIHIP